MSDFEETPRPARNTSLLIGLVCIFAVGACILVCAGLIGVGLVMPAVVRQQWQTQRDSVEREAAAANAAVRQAAEQAAAKARADESDAAATDDRPDTNENALPAAEDAPVKENPLPDDGGPGIAAVFQVPSRKLETRQAHVNPGSFSHILQ
jgi:hypothetical protein